MSRENQADFAEEQKAASHEAAQAEDAGNLSDPSIADNSTEQPGAADVSSAADEDPQNESESNLSSEELVQLRQQLDEANQRYLRAQADFDNFRKRTRQEKEELAKYASMKLISELLPVIDNFERALDAAKEAKDAEAVTKGVDMIFRQLNQVLSNEGLQAMEAVGQPFNPEFHQAVMTVESSDYEEGYVVEELQKGYMLKDKVLRPATVKVSS